jgi:hypothetical protein
MMTGIAHAIIKNIQANIFIHTGMSLILLVVSDSNSSVSKSFCSLIGLVYGCCCGLFITSLLCANLILLRCYMSYNLTRLTILHVLRSSYLPILSIILSTILYVAGQYSIFC